LESDALAAVAGTKFDLTEQHGHMCMSTHHTENPTVYIEAKAEEHIQK